LLLLKYQRLDIFVGGKVGSKLTKEFRHYARRCNGGGSGATCAQDFLLLSNYFNEKLFYQEGRVSWNIDPLPFQAPFTSPELKAINFISRSYLAVSKNDVQFVFTFEADVISGLRKKIKRYCRSRWISAGVFSIAH